MRGTLLILLALICLPAGAQAAPEAAEKSSEPDLPLCVKADTVKWWEDAYCQTRTKVDDHAATDFKKCKRQLAKKKALPRPTCQRIRWFKARTCAAWKKTLKPEEFTDCLRGKTFIKTVDENYEYYFGG